jgi:hypothetical protein
MTGVLPIANGMPAMKVGDGFVLNCRHVDM